MRKNLVRHLESGERILPGIVGYDETVIPEIENAILSGHHMVFLGERGQGKSRIIRGLISLLDERIPIVAGCEINYNPNTPICRACRKKAEELGDALPIQWVDRDSRYGEKLATPDVSIADLVGEIDPIKVAEGRYLADEETIHYGLVPSNNRSCQVEVPRYIKEILGHLTFEARKSNEINQSSGVSVRVTINNYESLISNAEKRALRCKENAIVPRISDLHALLASTSGK